MARPGEWRQKKTTEKGKDQKTSSENPRENAVVFLPTNYNLTRFVIGAPKVEKIACRRLFFRLRRKALSLNEGDLPRYLIEVTALSLCHVIRRSPVLNLRLATQFAHYTIKIKQ